MTIHPRSTYSSVEAVRPMRVLDLFSAAAGGWSLGLHRAGFVTVAACEVVEWRRILYSENNPGVHLYDDVRSLTADRIVSDLGYLPDVIVGSPPCQDISSANTKGKGIEGERSGLYLEAVRLVGECRPRWFAFENSANLRTRGADAVLAELEALGYACWSFVVRASDIGANHERARSWLIGCDTEQVGNANSQSSATGLRVTQEKGRIALGARCLGPDSECRRDGALYDADASRIGHEGGRSRGHGQDGLGEAYASHPHENREPAPSLDGEMADSGTMAGDCQPGNPADADEARQPHGRLESGLRPAEIPDDGRGDRRRDDGSGAGQLGGSAGAGGDAAEPWADWNGGLAHHLRLDDGLSAWVAGTRIATGSGKRTSAASLIVEAFGDAVVPQIPEAIGRAILRVEAALSAVSASNDIKHREGAR